MGDVLRRFNWSLIIVSCKLLLKRLISKDSKNISLWWLPHKCISLIFEWIIGWWLFSNKCSAKFKFSRCLLLKVLRRSLYLILKHPCVCRKHTALHSEHSNLYIPDFRKLCNLIKIRNFTTFPFCYFIVKACFTKCA